MTDSDQYILGYRDTEQQRLQQQAEQLAPESQWLFEEIGLARGAHVAEIGCGPRGCLDLLAERVGPSGRVLGIDRNAQAVKLAQGLVDQYGLENVQVLCRDARSTELPGNQFDLVTSRLVLVNIPQPGEVLTEAKRLAKSGGWIALHEADWLGHICDPPSAAWETIVRLFVQYSEMNGIDPYVGRKLPRLFRDAGITRVCVNPIVHVYPPGHPRRQILLDFADNLSERFLAYRLIERRELAKLKNDLRHHLNDPETFVVSHLFFQVWGQKE